MVKIMENPIKIHDLVGKPPIFGNTHKSTLRCFLFLQVCQLEFQSHHFRWVGKPTPPRGLGFTTNHFAQNHLSMVVEMVPLKGGIGGI